MKSQLKALTEIVNQEIDMVKKNRWLTDEEKRFKILQLKKLLGDGEQ
jgi:hypothetical protein